MANEYTSEQFKASLLETFKFTKDFLQQHNLRYIACGGTVLGAVRHKGFIPWDDDIDIYMPREDYNRLIALSPEMEPLGYEVISIAQPGYYMPFAKVSCRNTTIWEFERYPHVIGTYIDLFPLDEFEEPDEIITARQYRSHFYFDKYMNAVSQFSLNSFFQCLMHADVHGMGIRVLNWFRKRRPEHYRQAFLEFEQSYVGRKGSKCVCVTQWEGRIFQTKWFEDVVEYPFEDTTVLIPRDYDSYLRLLYGDYMQLPPENKRFSHPHYYVNLEKRLSLEEIRAEMKGRSPL